MEPEVPEAHQSDSTDSHGHNFKCKKALRVAKSENSVAVTDRVVARIHRNQAHTHSVRDLMDVVKSNEDSPTKKGQKVAEVVARVSLSQTKVHKRGIFPGLPIEAIERSVPLLTLTFVVGAFVLATVLLGRSGTVHEDV
ncbi:hypothetical protein IscW_ISCW002295 [Ixodes scapularis]|uniref:Uncharacterized protein n=1 Tax=Ixodes scapularis TaxID=6945 RepID=B7PCY2_IXOSC|nr:hypothetical protein IscW_ISCW002295 [Ixodes scapularis]|eukprot:XP_002410435.1 hypothetical protein IscW_ISCW002295 [Ixodes scapularis]